ncbi:52151c35-bda9-4ffa-8e26-67eb9443bfa5 [Thermothielavioides terrestris]|uniref:52151c35-bda9-4ffa-8e26-67eb9443bfa5 n=1 Tax=Thermothielavioides terrestris TaxID=2587410 RepID=A0A3S5CX68_9PEZI|nr:52151c35-bda9-4ffa-8e26-67eb9443bfa5 [Thermothielavioides terrestris]
MADADKDGRNNDSGNGNGSVPAPTPAPATKNKRDRENGMFADSLVDARSEELDGLLQRKLDLLFEKNRMMDIFNFIIKHRPGTPVRPHQSVRGSYNAVFGVEYTDGHAILRVPLPGSVAFGDEKVRAEVATMRYIEKMTSVPVPHIYHWGTAAENPLGLGAFIIMEYIPHAKNLTEVLGVPNVEGGQQKYLDPNVPKDKLERMYKQVAGIVLQLSKLEMPKIGSLREEEEGGSFIVGGRPLTKDMNDLVTMGGIPPAVLPPEDATYRTSDEWYAALADLHVAHLAFQRNNAIASADDCRDKFVARYLFRQQARRGKLLAPAHDKSSAAPAAAAADGRPPPGKWREKEKEKAKEKEKETFRLQIDDFRPHNILVDADLNVVGVVDWEWAYFAPASFARAPPWWLLLTVPEYWRGTVLDFRDEFAGVLDVFLGALRACEEDEEEEKEAKEAEDEEEEEEWSIERHISALSLSPDDDKDAVRLSDRMRWSWEAGDFWAVYAARRCYAFEPVFWEFLDERFFGENVEGGYEGRMHLLSEKAKRRMELLVERKLEERKEKKIVDWDPDEAKAYLAEILADLD